LLLSLAIVALTAATLTNNDWESAWADAIRNDIIVDHGDHSMPDVFDMLTAPSLAEIQLASRLSGASYCVGHNMKALAEWKCKACPTEAKMEDTTAWDFPGYHIGAYTGYDAANKKIRVVFRGSANVSNWMANLNTAQIPFGNNGKVHSGFRTAYLQTRTKIIEKIQALQREHGNVGVQVTGHSLGGSIALLAALDFKSGVTTTVFANGLTHVTSELFPQELPFTASQLTLLGAETNLATFPLSGPVITFGAPRTGDTAFAQFVQSTLSGTYFRITHRHDPVPRIPTISMNYAHSPQEAYFLGKDGDLSFKWCSTGLTEDKGCIIGPIANLAITDHMWYAGNYLKQDPDTCAPR